MCAEILLITGDFNFHMSEGENHDTNNFLEILETFGLIHHVMA